MNNNMFLFFKLCFSKPSAFFTTKPMLIFVYIFFFRFVKTCLQLASSCECNMQVRLDHFDQMLSMIRNSNMGKVFYDKIDMARLG